tara:strand:+ start:1097 stop:1558 length:462 start_codon:yes stop_codon:yes gene_type:complete
MSSLVIGGIGVAALFGGILLGINVMVVLGLVGAFGLAALVGFNAATAILGTVFFDTTHSFHFSVIPLFLLMGFFAMRAGLGEDLFEATTKWLGNLRGGLAIPPRSGLRPLVRRRAPPSGPRRCSPSWRCRRCSTGAMTKASPRPPSPLRARWQ